MSEGRPLIAPPLRGLRVGISGAVPEQDSWGEATALDQTILRFVSQLSGLVIKYGGEVVHGSHPSFTPVIAAQARHFQTVGTGKALTLIASELFGDPPPVVARCVDVADVLLTPKIGEGGPSSAATRNDSLTCLRMTLAQEIDVVVAVGGKLHGSTGYHPGVLEELTLARWHDVPCFVVASYGGFASALDAGMLAKFTAGNGLGAKAKEAMAVWDNDVDGHVGELLEHLVANCEQLAVRRRIGAQLADWLNWNGLRDLRQVLTSFTDAMGGRPRRLGMGSIRRQAVEPAFVHQTSLALAPVRDAFSQGATDRLGHLLSVPPPHFARETKRHERKLEH